MTILDNQEVDAAILNGIAKDLGATVFDKFKDGVKFGVDELNDITAALVTPGVLGNDGDSCKVVIVDGQISVGTGTIVFASGAKLKITENQVLEMVPNIKTHVVAVNDTANNRMLLYNSEAIPEGEDFVLLGEVSAEGKVMQNYNRWAQSKSESPQNTKKIITFEGSDLARGTPAGTVLKTFFVEDLCKYCTAVLKIVDPNSYGKYFLGEDMPFNLIFYYDMPSEHCIGCCRVRNGSFALLAPYNQARTTSPEYNGIPVTWTAIPTGDLYPGDLLLKFSGNEISIVSVEGRSYNGVSVDGARYTLELL